MAKTFAGSSIKNLLADIAESVSSLPKHLQETAFSTLLNHALDSQQGQPLTPPKSPTGTLTPDLSKQHQLTDSFGDYFGSFPAKMKEDEKMLVAASFAEAQSADKTFTVDSAHSLLKEIGVKLSNAAVFAKRLVSKKWAITIGKAGKKTYKFRVSANGHRVLKELKLQEE